MAISHTEYYSNKTFDIQIKQWYNDHILDFAISVLMNFILNTMQIYSSYTMIQNPQRHEQIFHFAAV